MSTIGNSPGVASQRVVTEEVITGSAKAAFYPVGGYTLGYVDVLINGVELDATDFTANNGVSIMLTTPAQVGDTVKIKCFIPRGLSDGYLKSEADAKFPLKPTGTPNGSKFLRDDNSWQTVTAPSPTAVSDQANTSTGYFDLPAGTTAQRPASPSSGMTRFNTDTGAPEWYDPASGSWIKYNQGVPYTIEFLAVAGGGGGGAGYYGGGGGAGGVAYASQTIVSGSTLLLTVGGGGAGSVAINTQGADGVASTVSVNGSATLTAVGGGGGGSRNNSSGGAANGRAGGSGGGASWPSSSGGSGTAGQGYAGVSLGASQYGGGGGGAGGTGTTNGEPLLGGNGGPGTNAYSTWHTATSTGVSGYIGGGGGAGTRSGGAGVSLGGSGGGGNAGVQSGRWPVAGTVNTGGGGGGADTGDSSNASDPHYCGAAGGSGLILIRYSGAQKILGGVVTSSGGYTYHTFTSTTTVTA